eukprot:TRINITY_DN1508_c0_g2_i1.p1 TRINITY_DN1508_c0_g2~~TRINITY_DN1508_c0_g2_i1.p1  ORF type:complete len:464 (-),score=124.55 TRINITY_DN1508_c0_g2_i1:72-1463(-)
MSSKKTASETAADYAAKKKAQMERAAKLKEERKRGGGSSSNNSYDDEPDPEPIVQAPAKPSNRPSSAIPKFSNNSNNSMPSEYPAPTKSASSSNSSQQPPPKSIHGPLIKRTGLPFDLNGPTNPASLTLLKQKHGMQPTPSPSSSSSSTKQTSVPPSRGAASTISKPAASKARVAQPPARKPVQPEPQEEEYSYTQYDDPNDSAPIPTLSGESNSNAPDLYSSGDVRLVECPNCNRKFAADRLAKHAKICKKVFIDKRKVFDSTSARVEGTEAAAFVAATKKKEALEAKKAAKSGAPKSEQTPLPGAAVPKWKVERAQLRAAMRAARGDSNSGGVEDSAPAEPYVDPNLVQCPSCGRRFNPISADKHIQICQNQKTKPKRLEKGGGMSAAKARSLAAPSSPAPSALQPKKTIGMGNTMSPMSATNNGAPVPCPYCNRKFEFHAFQRHSEICAKVQNKPKGVRR